MLGRRCQGAVSKSCCWEYLVLFFVGFFLTVSQKSIFYFFIHMLIPCPVCCKYNELVLRLMHVEIIMCYASRMI